MFASGSSSKASGAPDYKLAVFALLAAVCACAPMDTAQLVFAACGALLYYLGSCTGYVQREVKDVERKTEAPSTPTKPAGHAQQPRRRVEARSPHAQTPQRSTPQRSSGRPPTSPQTPQTLVQSESVQPVAAAKFEAVGFDGQVRELLDQIAPTPESDRVVKGIACAIRKTVQKIVPDVEVVGVANGSLSGRTAFGVAVPDVDIVVHISPDALSQRLPQGAPAGPEQKQEAARRRQKGAIRACTDCLVGSGLFKFRRSAFRGPDPKVTLLVPPSSGLCSEAVPIDLSVNSATPLHSAALLSECGQMEPRARDLILLVRRWARDRGICHSSKGHLSPYAWTLLVIYYLQVCTEHGGPLLPPLDRFAKASGLLGSSAPGATWHPKASEGPAASAAALFAGFVGFLHRAVDWRKEAADVRSGERAPPDAAADINVVIGADGVAAVGPTVPDPFEPSRNVASCVTAVGLSRLSEELARAAEFCGRGGQLEELLEPWRPNWGEAEEEPAP